MNEEKIYLELGKIIERLEKIEKDIGEVLNN